METSANHGSAVRARALLLLVPLALPGVLPGCRDKGTAADAAPPITGPLSSLLSEPARVAVSSIADDSDANPNCIVDGDPATAWRGRGDIFGSWIDLELPADDRVAALEIAFPIGAPGIIVERNGQPLTQMTLERDRRDAQRIPINAAGGSFRIRIGAWTPATLPKAMVVSELDVLGVPGKSREGTPPKKPSVQVGSLNGVSLLQTTPARLAVEWQFETDGDPFKAWKGKWLAVRIPSDAHVASIHLRVDGKVSATVSRDGTKLREVSLDGQSEIPIDGPGGDLRVDFAGELRSISSLDVVGQPGATRKSVASLPAVRYGSLDLGEHLSGPWPTLMAYCEKRGGDRCSDSPPARDRNGTWFATKTKRGWFVHQDAKNVEPRSERRTQPEAGAPFESFVHVDRSHVGTHEIAVRELVVCRFIDDYPDCDERHELGMWDGPMPPPSGKWNEPKAPRFLPDAGVLVE